MQIRARLNSRCHGVRKRDGETTRRGGGGEPVVQETVRGEIKEEEREERRLPERETMGRGERRGWMKMREAEDETVR